MLGSISSCKPSHNDLDTSSDQNCARITFAIATFWVCRRTKNNKRCVQVLLPHRGFLGARQFCILVRGVSESSIRPVTQ